MRHLLQSQGIEGPTAFLVLVACAVALFILFFIIKAAVRAGQKETVKMLQILINLKAEEMKQDGISEQTVLEAAGKVEKLRNLEKMAEEGKLTARKLEELKSSFVHAQ